MISPSQLIWEHYFTVMFFIFNNDSIRAKSFRVYCLVQLRIHKLRFNLLHLTTFMLLYKPFQSAQRALNFLSQGSWERKVSSIGQVSIYGQRFSVGISHKHQRVSIRICSTRNAWQVFDAAGSLIKYVPTKISEETLWKLDLS